MKYFYDTCSLLFLGEDAFKGDEQFFISIYTKKEIEYIKSSGTKDPDTKYKARKLARLLKDNQEKYQTVFFRDSYNDILKEKDFLEDNNDSRILISAYVMSAAYKDLIFVTDDIACYDLAVELGLNVSCIKDDNSDGYTGFTTLELNDFLLSEFYMKVLPVKESNPYKILLNQYLVIKNPEGEIVDMYKWTEEGFKPIKYATFESQMFGRIKPKDEFQELAMDSLKTNKMTMLRGSAGTGKSYLALGYLFEKLEAHEISKIIIFCNTVATQGAAKLGLMIG